MDSNLKKHSSLWHERLEVLMAVNIKFMVFLDQALYSFVVRYQCCGLTWS
jgi:hypothetical protein